jgi:hypothetical protein
MVMSAPGGGAPGPPQGVGGPGPVRLAGLAGGRLAGPAGPVGAHRQAHGRLLRLVGRAAPAPVRGPGPGERPRRGVPGRADPGAGSRRSSGGLGAHRRHQGPGGHGGAGDPLHGRGRAALRPDRRDRRRPGGRHRHPAGADLPVRRPDPAHLHARRPRCAVPEGRGARAGRAATRRPGRGRRHGAGAGAGRGGAGRARARPPRPQGGAADAGGRVPATHRRPGPQREEAR